MKLELSKKYFKILLLFFALLIEKNFHAAGEKNFWHAVEDRQKVNNNMSRLHQAAVGSQRVLHMYVSDANKINATHLTDIIKRNFLPAEKDFSEKEKKNITETFNEFLEQNSNADTPAEYAIHKGAYTKYLNDLEKCDPSTPEGIAERKKICLELSKSKEPAACAINDLIKKITGQSKMIKDFGNDTYFHKHRFIEAILKQIKASRNVHEEIEKGIEYLSAKNSLASGVMNNYQTKLEFDAKEYANSVCTKMREDNSKKLIECTKEISLQIESKNTFEQEIAKFKKTYQTIITDEEYNSLKKLSRISPAFTAFAWTVFGCGAYAVFMPLSSAIMNGLKKIGSYIQDDFSDQILEHEQRLIALKNRIDEIEEGIKKGTIKEENVSEMLDNLYAEYEESFRILEMVDIENIQNFELSRWFSDAPKKIFLFASYCVFLWGTYYMLFEKYTDSILSKKILASQTWCKKVVCKFLNINYENLEENNFIQNSFGKVMSLEGKKQLSKCEDYIKKVNSHIQDEKNKLYQVTTKLEKLYNEAKAYVGRQAEIHDQMNVLSEDYKIESELPNELRKILDSGTLSSEGKAIMEKLFSGNGVANETGVMDKAYNTNKNFKNVANNTGPI